VRARAWRTRAVDHMPFSTRSVGIGADCGLALRSNTGQKGVVMVLTKSNLNPSGCEVHLPYYIKNSGSVTVSVDAKITAENPPVGGKTSFWPLVLEDATGIHKGFGLELRIDSGGNWSANLWYRDNWGKLRTDALVLDWAPTYWNNYTFIWRATSVTFLVNGVDKSTDGLNAVAINDKLLVCAELTANWVGTNRFNELDTFFDVYTLCRHLSDFVADV